jgi:hypothetical protein
VGREAAGGEVAETASPAADPASPESEQADHHYVPRHGSGHSSPPTPVFSSLNPATKKPPNQADDDADSFTAQPRVEAQEADLSEPEGAPGTLITDIRLPALAPYRAWLPHQVPDVRDSSRQQVVIKEIIDIVTAEGPAITERVYELYLRASGGIRVTKPVRDALDEATATAVEKGQLKQIRDRLTSRLVKTLYLPQTPSIVLRRRSDRELEHIPPTEVAAVARHIISNDASMNDNELKRLILTAFERVRMTTTASQFLDDCIDIARRYWE